MSELGINKSVKELSKTIMEKGPGKKTYKITSCARCGNDHEGITYRRLTNPLVVGNTIFTHWTLCPDLDEPIMMYFVGIEEEEVKVVALDR